MKNKTNLTVNLFHNISILIIGLSFLFLISSCRINKTKSDTINSKQAPSKSNVNNIQDNSKSKKTKKFSFHDFWISLSNPYQDIDVDPEEYPDFDYERQIEYDDIRDQRD